MVCCIWCSGHPFHGLICGLYYHNHTHPALRPLICEQWLCIHTWAKIISQSCEYRAYPYEWHNVCKYSWNLDSAPTRLIVTSIIIAYLRKCSFTWLRHELWSECPLNYHHGYAYPTYMEWNHFSSMEHRSYNIPHTWWSLNTVTQGWRMFCKSEGSLGSSTSLRANSSGDMLSRKTRNFQLRDCFWGILIMVLRLL